MGPVTDVASSEEFRFGRVQIELASGQAGANFDLFTSRSADEQGIPDRSGILQAGANGRIGGALRGGSAWVRLQTLGTAERWALESISMSLYPAGRKRVR